METQARPKRRKPQSDLHKLKIRVSLKRSHLRRFEAHYRTKHAELLAVLRDLELEVEAEEQRIADAARQTASA